MTLKDQIRADAARFVNPDEFGEAIVYNVATIGTSTIDRRFIDALVDPAIDAEDLDVITTTIDLLILDGTGDEPGITNPKPGDSVELRGFRWHVSEIIPEPDAGTHVVRAERGERGYWSPEPVELTVTVTASATKV